jgi:hypothetical protein
VEGSVCAKAAQPPMRNTPAATAGFAHAPLAYQLLVRTTTTPLCRRALPARASVAYIAARGPIGSSLRASMAACLPASQTASAPGREKGNVPLSIWGRVYFLHRTWRRNADCDSLTHSQAHSPRTHQLIAHHSSMANHSLPHSSSHPLAHRSPSASRNTVAPSRVPTRHQHCRTLSQRCPNHHHPTRTQFHTPLRPAPSTPACRRLPVPRFSALSITRTVPCLHPLPKLLHEHCRFQAGCRHPTCQQRILHRMLLSHLQPRDAHARQAPSGWGKGRGRKRGGAEGSAQQMWRMPAGRKERSGAGWGCACVDRGQPRARRGGDTLAERLGPL